MAVEYQFWTGNQMYSEYGLFIGNGWRNAEGGATAEVRSPVTEQVLGLAPQASVSDTEQAIAMAERGLAAWRKAPA